MHRKNALHDDDRSVAQKGKNLGSEPTQSSLLQYALEPFLHPTTYHILREIAHILQ